MKRLILPALAVVVLAATIAANWPTPSTAEAPAQWGGANASGAAGAFMNHSGRGHFGRGMGGPYARLLRDDRLAEQLKLTTTQRSRLHAIAEEQQRKAIQMRADAELARLDLGKLMREDRPDRNRIESQIDAITTLRAAQMKSAIGAGLDARETLTAEQRKQLEGMRRAWRGGDHRGGRGGKEHGPGGRGPGGRGSEGPGSQDRGDDSDLRGTSTES